MKITAALAVWLCAAFAALCFGVAIYAFSALPGLEGQEEREMAAGYGWFWAFLGAVGCACGGVSWLIKVGKIGGPE